METPFMYLIEYNEDFRKACRSGWGCGYVAIPADHPLAVANADRLAREHEAAANAPEGEYYCFNKYLEIPGIDQEITYTEPKEFGGIPYIIAGFDTAHSYNSSADGIEYVMQETKKILDIVINYKP